MHVAGTEPPRTSPKDRRNPIGAAWAANNKHVLSEQGDSNIYVGGHMADAKQIERSDRMRRLSSALSDEQMGDACARNDS